MKFLFFRGFIVKRLILYVQYDSPFISVFVPPAYFNMFLIYLHNVGSWLLCPGV